MKQEDVVFNIRKTSDDFFYPFLIETVIKGECVSTNFANSLEEADKFVQEQKETFVFEDEKEMEM
jgi:hypothetical protein